jgi:hypothetical protein
LLAVIGAVLATLVTGALNTSPAARLIGASIGAAIPVLVTAGGAQGLALSMVITGGALFITYGGFTIFDYADDKDPTFPIPRVMPPPGPEPTPTTMTTENGLSLAYAPDTVHCDSDGCDEDVTVTSTGEEVLEIGVIEFDGDPSGEFGYGGNCGGQKLQEDQSCQISVSFTPSGAAGTRKATLLIHQNLKGPPTEVTVEGVAGGSEPPATSDVVLNGIECRYQEGGAVVNGQLRNGLQIFYDLEYVGEGQAPSAVRVEGRSNHGPFDSRTGAIGPGRHLGLPLDPDDYGVPHTVTLRVDPDSKVAESNEDNNQFRVRVFVPSQPASTQTLSCSAS